MTTAVENRRSDARIVEPVLVRTEADLLALMRPESLLHPFRKPPVLIGMPRLSAAENAAWGRRLEYFRQQCGCTAALMGLGAFTLASLAYVVEAALDASPPIKPGCLPIIIGSTLLFAGLIASTLLGKFAGLSLAAIRFRQTCRALQTRLETLQNETVGMSKQSMDFAAIS
jgi:hypothetical protein